MIFPSVMVAGGKPEVEFQTFVTDLTDATSYTFNDVPLGDPHSRRFIVAAVLARTSSNLPATSVTIAGVAATQIATHFWIALVPTGASGAVIATTAAAQNCSLAVWSVKNLRSASPVDTVTVLSPASLSVQKYGIACGLALGGALATSVTWSGLTENSEIITELSYRMSVASGQSNATGSAPVSATIAPSGTAILHLISLR